MGPQASRDAPQAVLQRRLHRRRPRDANDAALQRAARKLVDDQVQRDLSEGNTFGFESTYSGRSRPDIVRTAKRLGYTTRAVFLGTETVAINIRRVRKRVEEGDTMSTGPK